MQPTTPENWKEKWNLTNLALKHIIQKLEESSQCFGRFNDKEDVGEEDDDCDDDYSNKEGTNNDNNGTKGHVCGSLSNRSQQSLELGQNFVDGRSTYLLYFWDVWGLAA